MLTPNETVELLLNCEHYVERSKICTAQPLRVQHNCTFIVDLSSLKDTGDVKCDDLGSWKNNSYKKFGFYIEDVDGYNLPKSVTAGKDSKDPEYALRREYFQLCKDFRKRIDTVISKYYGLLSSN